MQTAVFIGTTEGPSRIQQIVEEDSQIQSFICLDGRAVPLPISAAYHDFVREPIGIIQKQFGHGAFSMDVSMAIDTGLSWQLGVYVGHHLAHHGLLAAARSDRTADGAGAGAVPRVVWATGEVDRRLKVRPVERIPEKLAHSEPLFERLVADGTGEILILMGPENAAQARPWVEERQERLKLRLLVVETIETIAAYLETGTAEAASVADRSPDSSSSSPPSSSRSGASRGRRFVAVAALLILVGGGLAFLSSDFRKTEVAGPVGPETDPSETDPSETDPSETGSSETDPSASSVPLTPPALYLAPLLPEELNCAAVDLGRTRLIAGEARRLTAEGAQTSFEEACGMRLSVRAEGTQRYLAAFAELPTRVKPDSADRLWGRPAVSDFKVLKITWDVMLPRRLRRSHEHRIIAMASDEKIDDVRGLVGQSADMFEQEGRSAIIIKHRLLP